MSKLNRLLLAFCCYMGVATFIVGCGVLICMGIKEIFR